MVGSRPILQESHGLAQNLAVRRPVIQFLVQSAKTLVDANAEPLTQFSLDNLEFTRMLPNSYNLAAVTAVPRHATPAIPRFTSR
jgi:hypothetical protein